MPSAKPALLLCSMLITTALLTRVGYGDPTPATKPPTTQVSKIEPPKELVEQDALAVDSRTIPDKDEKGNYRLRDKVIVLSPPKEYVDWFQQKTGCDGAYNIRVEALPFEDELNVSLCSISSCHDLDADSTITKGWDVKVLISKQEMLPGNRRRVAGQIEVLVRPGQQVIFPFDAEISLSNEKNLWS
jgi:hypothetical protein